MLRKLYLVAVALLPFTLAQTSNDFESGWDQTAWPIYAPDCNQGGTVALDSTVAHSGTHSMKVTSPGGYCGHIFFGTTAIPSGNVYVKVWVMATTALTSNHVSFLTMPDSSQGTGENLRFGGQDQILMYNRESDDATMPDMSPQGTAASVPLPTGSWQCLEYHLGTDGTIETWLNSNAIAGLTIYPGVTNVDATAFQKSTYIPKITGVYFGWESYGGDANTFWYDDIAVSSTRVGCSSTGTSPTTTTTTPVSTSKTTTTTSSSTKPTTTTITTSSSAKPTTTTSSSAKPTTTSSSASTGPSGCSTAKYGQCGGTGWSGCSTCAAGSTCTFSNAYYSQCL